jgi:hypothetical protein
MKCEQNSHKNIHIAKSKIKLEKRKALKQAEESNKVNKQINFIRSWQNNKIHKMTNNL